jgi:cytochrome c oxidase cbb3-type subunit 4
MTKPAAGAEEAVMDTYTAMRHFADSWALLAMALFFVGVVFFAFRPGSRKLADEAANIPLKDD